jgi:REP element-mobilizing transposase RayT
MPQSLAKIYVHLVFSTKNREPLLCAEHQTNLHAYMGGTLNGMECVPIEINTEPDHAHVLFILGRKTSLSEVVGGLKKSATEWLKQQSPRYQGFHWQAGFGAFSVSQSSVESVREYIRNQQAHHQKRSFQDDFRAMLHKYDLPFDERYVWD